MANAQPCRTFAHSLAEPIHAKAHNARPPKGTRFECLTPVLYILHRAVNDCIVRKNVDRFELVLKYIYPFILSPNLRYFLSSEPGDL